MSKAAPSAMPIPTHCRSTSVSPRKTIASSIVKAGYRAVKGEIKLTGPRDTATRYPSAPSIPSTPVMLARITPLGSVSDKARRDFRNKSKQPPEYDCSGCWKKPCSHFTPLVSKLSNEQEGVPSGTPSFFVWIKCPYKTRLGLLYRSMGGC